MKVIIAPDKFKGSLTAVEAAEAMAGGVLDVLPDCEVVRCPMADGGDGTVEAIAAATGAEVRSAEVNGPLPGQKVAARWALLEPGMLSYLAGAGGAVGALSPDERTAVIEMAQASGLRLVPGERRDPFVTDTFGTGQLVTTALNAGCGQVVVGIGGSATVDGGCGMASALGYRFLDGGGNVLLPGGASLERIRSIDTSGRDPRLSDARFLVATDVDNPLVGDDGAARVYGPQKGATPGQVESLENGLENLGELLESGMGVELHAMPGAGAAGGLGAGLVAFCGAEIVSGVELVAGVVGLRRRIEGADLVLTGEGSYDSQTSRGKAPAGVAAVAREAGVPVVFVAGRLSGDCPAPEREGVAAFSVTPGPMSEGEAMRNAGELVRAGTARLMRLVCLFAGG